MLVELSYDEAPQPAARPGSRPTCMNKRMPARRTVGDGDLATQIGVSAHPAPGTYITVFVNGVQVPEVGDGTRVGASCFFSNTNGATARRWADVSMGDTLHWQASEAGYQLDVTDVIDLHYEEKT